MPMKINCHRMGREPTRKLTVRTGSLVRYRVLIVEISEAERIIKLLGDSSSHHDPYLHLGLATRALAMEPHITFERPSEGQDKHRYFRPMSREEMLMRSLTIFSTPESRPPRITSVENKEEMDRAYLWFRRASRRTIHIPRHRRIKVFKEGPAKELISRILNQSLSNHIDIDVDEAIKLSKKNWNEPDSLDTVYEDEIKPKGLEIGFLENPSRVVFLAPGKPVIEFSYKMLMRWIHSLDRMPGMREFLAEAQRRIIPK